MNVMDVSSWPPAPALGADDRAYVFAVVRRILRDDDDANDATQDALLLAHRHRAQFRGDSAHRTWLHRIAVMSALALLRRQRRQRSRAMVSVDEPVVAQALADPMPSPETTAAAKQLTTRVERALAKLTSNHREVFVRRLADWRESEIADDLGISVANVKIRTHRARLRLRAVLTSEPEVEARRSPHAPFIAASASRTPG